jgi:S-adenosylmethionine synthetase
VFALAERVNAVIARRYAELRRSDPRWVAKWPEVELLVNPNGPLSDAGSRKDNGQTGRKLVMDYYGPRIPLGGGAVYGKHPSHIDRFGARQARRLAVDAVRRGAGECLVRVAYAPNVPEPLDVHVEMARGDIRIPTEELVMHGAEAGVTHRQPSARVPLDWFGG